MYPVLFEVGNIFVSTMWALVGLGFLVWGIVLVKLSQAQSMKMAFLVNTFFMMLFWGAICGRATHLLVNLSDLIVDPKGMIPLRIISIWDHGFNFWGIVLGMATYLAYAAKEAEENLWRWLDILAVALLAATPFGHLGALFEGAGYGHETNLPWGITFESFTVPYTVPIHPTQLYAFTYSITILIVIGVLFLRGRFEKDGDAALFATLSYSIMRFTEEFFRGDEAITIWRLNLAHWIALALFLFAGISLLIRYNRLTFISKHFSKTP